MLWCGAVAAAKTITVLFCSHERFISQTSESKPINPAGQICSHKEPHLNARTESIQRTSIYSAAHKHERGRKLISRQILSLWCALLFPLSVCTAAGCMCAKSSGFKIKKNTQSGNGQKKNKVWFCTIFHLVLPLLERNEAKRKCKSCGWELHQHKQTQSRAW